MLYELVVAVGGLGLCGGGPPSLAVCRRLAVCDPSLWLIPFARLALKQTTQCQSLRYTLAYLLAYRSSQQPYFWGVRHYVSWMGQQAYL